MWILDVKKSWREVNVYQVLLRRIKVMLAAFCIELSLLKFLFIITNYYSLSAA